MKRSLVRMLGASLSGGIAVAACASATSGGPAPASGQPAGAGATVAIAVEARTDSGRPSYTAADVRFISGMISHHAQAVLIAGWAVSPAYGASTAVRALSERIVVAQTDEIAFMQRWLAERHEAVPPADPRGHTMPGMEHPTLMPGMLTPEQLAELDRARGPEFDRLFLRFMIQHHEGAITMVEQLLSAHGAAQDGLVFRFAADVNADQTTEIERMRRMLAALPPGEKSP